MIAADRLHQKELVGGFFIGFAARSTPCQALCDESTPCQALCDALCDASIVCANTQKVSLLFGELLKKQYFCVR